MKIRKLNFFAVLIIAMLSVITISLSACGSKSASSNDFKTENEYLYKGIPWGATVEEVEKKLNCDIEKDEYRVTESGDPVFYKSTEKFVLDDREALVSLEFYEDKLGYIQIAFNTDGDYEKWFEKQAEELIKVYGKESKKYDGSGENELLGQVHSVYYKWEADNTSMQIGLMTGANIKPSLTITLADKEISAKK